MLLGVFVSGVFCIWRGGGEGRGTADDEEGCE